MLGVIGALEVEVEGIIGKMSNNEVQTYSGISYVKGKWNNAEIVVAQCGIGKVNAAICAQTMILMYSPETIINTGVAGSLSPNVKINDVVIGKYSVHHDIDLARLELNIGFIEGLDELLIPCTQNVVDSLESAAKKHGNYHLGIIATGDQFISSGDIKSKIYKNFNALACEMEGASIAQVCYLNKIKCGIIRAISDNADEDSDFDFNEFLQGASQKSLQILEEFITTQNTH
ncbi:MAG: 5'-methylthioadenosine/adenosylhomocysteine nucleosidase [Defluviitaleaceae bacterium]|nr:5'-methylthioadenosine/adenosylhomocysteine nucleosidase [Defluviitaleaceae bacterium]